MNPNVICKLYMIIMHQGRSIIYNNGITLEHNIDSTGMEYKTLNFPFNLPINAEFKI